MAEKVEKGMTSSDKGVFIPIKDRAPRRPEYLHMSKANMRKAEDKRLADEKEINELRKKQAAPKSEPKEEVVSESKVAEVAKKKSKK